jgi:hypothetical protein
MNIDRTIIITFMNNQIISEFLIDSDYCQIFKATLIPDSTIFMIEGEPIHQLSHLPDDPNYIISI